MVKENWQVGMPTLYDTIIYNGKISKFADVDTTSYFNPNHYYDTNYVNKDKIIKINFLQNLIVTPELDTNGELIQVYYMHYHHAGGFVDLSLIHI